MATTPASARPPADELADAAALGATMPLATELGLVVTAASTNGVEGELAWRPELCTVGGLLHGGALMAFADSLGAVAAFLHLPEGASTSTVSSNTTFVSGVRDGVVTGRATVEHAGSRMIAVRTELHRGDGRLVATTTQSQIVLT